MIIQVFVPATERVYALRQQTAQRVLDPRRSAPIFKHGGGSARQTNAFIDLAQPQQPSIRTEFAAIEISADYTPSKLASAISLSVSWLFGLNTNYNAASSAIADFIHVYLDEISGPGARFRALPAHLEPAIGLAGPGQLRTFKHITDCSPSSPGCRYGAKAVPQFPLR